jgi:TolB-like protein
VLPFANPNEDPKYHLLGDGITDNIINTLSKVEGLFVIARNSTFTYKGKPVSIKQVSEDLGVRYVLEGSIQASGDRIRITAQLIDALIGGQIWAERYEGAPTDIFNFQDDIITKVVRAVVGKLKGGLTSQGKFFTGTKGLECQLKLLEAQALINQFDIPNQCCPK